MPHRRPLPLTPRSLLSCRSSPPPALQYALTCRDKYWKDHTTGNAPGPRLADETRAATKARHEAERTYEAFAATGWKFLQCSCCGKYRQLDAAEWERVRGGADKGKKKGKGAGAEEGSREAQWTCSQTAGGGPLVSHQAAASMLHHSAACNPHSASLCCCCLLWEQALLLSYPPPASPPDIPQASCVAPEPPLAQLQRIRGVSLATVLAAAAGEEADEDEADEEEEEEEGAPGAGEEEEEEAEEEDEEAEEDEEEGAAAGPEQPSKQKKAKKKVGTRPKSADTRSAATGAAAAVATPSRLAAFFGASSPDFCKFFSRYSEVDEETGVPLILLNHKPERWRLVIPQVRLAAAFSFAEVTETLGIQTVRLSFLVCDLLVCDLLVALSAQSPRRHLVYFAAAPCVGFAQRAPQLPRGATAGDGGWPAGQQAAFVVFINAGGARRLPPADGQKAAFDQFGVTHQFKTATCARLLRSKVLLSTPFA